MKKNYQDISDYYSEKVKTYGDSPKGVDWNDENSQNVRFNQLLKIIEPATDSFSIFDLGCGYGAICDVLMSKKCAFQYIGYDFSSEMIKKAQARFQKHSNIAFVDSNKTETQCDYAIASGIMNVKLARDDSSWNEYFVIPSLKQLDQSSRKGFACNFLSTYSDVEKRKDYLFYADPCLVFDYCKKNFSKNVALLHDYSLFEFTILVRK